MLSADGLLVLFVLQYLQDKDTVSNLLVRLVLRITEQDS